MDMARYPACRSVYHVLHCMQCGGWVPAPTSQLSYRPLVSRWSDTAVGYYTKLHDQEAIAISNTERNCDNVL